MLIGQYIYICLSYQVNECRRPWERRSLPRCSWESFGNHVKSKFLILFSSTCSSLPDYCGDPSPPQTRARLVGIMTLRRSVIVPQTVIPVRHFFSRFGWYGRAQLQQRWCSSAHYKVTEPQAPRLVVPFRQLLLFQLRFGLRTGRRYTYSSSGV